MANGPNRRYLEPLPSTRHGTTNRFLGLYGNTCGIMAYNGRNGSQKHLESNRK